MMQLKQLLLIWTLIMDKFDVFWDEMGAYFNENTPAVDDRWRQEILYMPIAIDLCEIIIHRLEAKYDVPLPYNINIQWIHLQFWPTNPTSTRAMHYTGQFNLKYQI
ncbi:hypothetical protein RirG_122570 [Rhizophagus irregularis DAOM 197198w]|uniref:Uncharacterized protein n=1 Tax=Rhizophagus irregularis (strain DAOM 197198w) TaxID=1432141 RepID=A0A015L2H1_RHIIW|nr:hypothetical protein RirG_122570 [Rhizophagus irregularis DAOM 197198w]